MSKSLLSNERRCYLCRTTLDLHKHHIFEGRGRRQLSEKYGCWIYLCAAHHNMSKHGVHADKSLDLSLKAECQKAWERKYGTTKDFIRIFGQSYLI